jgi:hypothetical protein
LAAIILSLLGCQTDPSAVRADLVMMAAVEEFAARQPGARPPEPFRSLIAALGQDCYKCRERASRRLAAASATDLRWLFWGRRSRDAEIRFRCNLILKELTRCGYCGGMGLCREYRPAPGAGNGPDGGDGPCRVCRKWAWNHPESPGLCEPCGGYGAAWIKDPFE